MDIKDRIRKIISQGASFSDVPQELMQAKHSTWERLLNQDNNKSNDSSDGSSESG
ncbi:hypothetical protein LCGC14_2046590 [marine sediment metagenome]|uniref:Uncharacterized protein n=1 Tax=marine sediment metagenome TaxID=412755 RepID=A0A0F9EQA3_9ZZZZ